MNEVSTKVGGHIIVWTLKISRLIPAYKNRFLLGTCNYILLLNLVSKVALWMLSIPAIKRKIACFKTLCPHK